MASTRATQRLGVVHEGDLDYLSSHRDPHDVALDALVLRTHGFPAGRVLARPADESYGDVAARQAPEVHDCESIGPGQITYPQIPSAARARIESIIIPEPAGIDHLPDAPKPCSPGSRHERG